jgi:hypothetical protein
VTLEFGDPIPAEAEPPEPASIDVDFDELRAQLAAEKVVATA